MAISAETIKKPRLPIGDWLTNCCWDGVPSTHIDESRLRVGCTKEEEDDAQLNIGYFIERATPARKRRQRAPEICAASEIARNRLVAHRPHI